MMSSFANLRPAVVREAAPRASTLATFLLLSSIAFPSAQGAMRIKLATLAPTGSSYHTRLLQMREAWRNASEGLVNLRIYADGKLGGEADTVGLMNLNSIQAAMLTAVGLAEIEEGVAGLQSIPMGFRDYAEVDYVGEKLQPMLEARLAEKGFVVLFWSDAGWVRFFSKERVTWPDDLKKLKLFTWAGNPDQVTIYKDAGFNPVPLETADILPGFQTGLIEAAPAPPVFALMSQIDTRAPYVLEINWAPLVGACVIRKNVWEKIPATVRAKLQKAARKIGEEVKANGRRESEEAVAAMAKRGLQVTPVTSEIETAWRAAAEAAYPRIRGAIVPAGVFDAALRAIKEYRERESAGAGAP
jgi:TRAP-type C4-dicarboxylate transport system substrate-binding protein